ncbi:hypothetical protein BV898_15936 [Hypsibius exemplaris]|uniref:Glycine zipper domain-containing protein n=1 Tax=Hypsibius exemplaris TaxID=2072580 RepID=A0A9X6RL15_HYPEX|nr:hypothetical protein BV898_15936 [Hypsibius exemplaris]
MKFSILSVFIISVLFVAASCMPGMMREERGIMSGAAKGGLAGGVAGAVLPGVSAKKGALAGAAVGGVAGAAKKNRSKR